VYLADTFADAATLLDKAIVGYAADDARRPWSSTRSPQPAAPPTHWRRDTAADLHPFRIRFTEPSTQTSTA
jgi:hypothetical protein